MSAKLKEAHRKLTERVMGRPGVAGTAIGTRKGKPCLKVYLERSGAGGDIPARVGGFPVVVEKTGPFRSR
ncbi:MAG TPA: hypothetical protein VE173_00710 [Longimicrobiales bacterium]|nr:hypothetical protein [Longimicrobiales bacterium]